MFFEKIDDIEKIAERVGCSIFVISDSEEIQVKNAFEIKPGEAGKVGIVIDQVKDVIQHVGAKETKSKYIIIHQAEQMNIQAANALLKNLEEPKNNYHYILQTETPSELLPTILSRSEMFILKQNNPTSAPIAADDTIKNLAKQLIVAKPADLPKIAEEITKKKDNARSYALEILKVTIEMCYKSYLKTEKTIFIDKIPGLIKAYRNINSNGNIKLHLVADML